MDSIKLDDSQGYKQCVGKACQNEGKIALTIQYLNKIGYFCESCSEDLIGLGFAVKQEIGH